MNDALFAEVINGLDQPIKRLPYRLLYEGRGADLFDRITQTKDYYLSRAELAVLVDALPSIASAVGSRVRVIEPGSGSAQKTRTLLSGLTDPAIYMPIDVATLQLDETARRLREEYPTVEILSVVADFTKTLSLPRSTREFKNTLVFFPGSTIGNFEQDEAHDFLRGLAMAAGKGAVLLLGADCNDNAAELLLAYDDRDGVTAAFNKNVLTVLNDSLGATFDVDQFTHRAHWNADRSRIEMHLVSRRDQSVDLRGRGFTFRQGEHIATEHCYKRSRLATEAMLREGGWIPQLAFIESERRMHLWLAASQP